MGTNNFSRSTSSCRDVDERFALRLLPSVLAITLAPKLVIDQSDILLVAAAVCSFGAGELPLLVELSQPLEITWDARIAVLECHHPARIALLGADDVDLVLTAFAVRSPTDVRFFTDRDDAELWLLRG